MKNNWNPHTLLQIRHGSATLESSLEDIFLKVPHTLMIKPSNPAIRYLPKKNEIMCSYKNLYVHVTVAMYIIIKI